MVLARFKSKIFEKLTQSGFFYPRQRYTRWLVARVTRPRAILSVRHPSSLPTVEQPTVSVHRRPSQEPAVRRCGRTSLIEGIRPVCPLSLPPPAVLLRRSRHGLPPDSTRFPSRLGAHGLIVRGRAEGAGRQRRLTVRASRSWYRILARSSHLHCRAPWRGGRGLRSRLRRLRWWWLRRRWLRWRRRLRWRVLRRRSLLQRLLLRRLHVLRWLLRRM
jgi:hypothetical protein